jgi:hypothetical protein
MSTPSDPLFDTPVDEDALQYEEGISPPEVPVHVQNVVRTDEMPTETAYKTLVLRNDGLPEKFLNADPKRKRIILWITNLGADAGIFIGKQTDIQSSMGGGTFLQVSTVPLRIEFTDRDEVWVRPADNGDNAGNWTDWRTAGSGVILSAIVENWGR